MSHIEMIMIDYEYDLRFRLTQVSKELYNKGLTHGSSGNISARVPESKTCLIKPSGYRFNDLKPKDFVLVNIDNQNAISGAVKPSIETPFHTRIYQDRPKVNGIVHIHSHFSTIMSILGKEITLMGFDIYQAPALVKGISISNFAPPGSEELADFIVEALKDKVACLIPHHGSITIGKTIEEAAINAEIVEKIAKLNFEVSMVGNPKPLPKIILKTLLNKAKKQDLLV
jgi:L-fuculose-phosphate aldolase